MTTLKITDLIIGKRLTSITYRSQYRGHTSFKLQCSPIGECSKVSRIPSRFCPAQTVIQSISNAATRRPLWRLRQYVVQIVKNSRFLHQEGLDPQSAGVYVEPHDATVLPITIRLSVGKLHSSVPAPVVERQMIQFQNFKSFCCDR